MRWRAARRRDPGYHLIGKGRRSFEEQLGFRDPAAPMAHPRQCSGGHFGLSGGDRDRHRDHRRLGLALVTRSEAADGCSGSWAILAVIPASDAAVSLVNRAATKRFGATILPGLALRGGVPESLRTMIVVPTLLTSRAAIEEQIERLEVHYLANDVGDLRFALLSDWTRLRDGDGPRRRGAAGDRGRGHRAPEPSS